MASLLRLWEIHWLSTTTYQPCTNNCCPILTQYTASLSRIAQLSHGASLKMRLVLRKSNQHQIDQKRNALSLLECNKYYLPNSLPPSEQQYWMIIQLIASAHLNYIVNQKINWFRQTVQCLLAADRSQECQFGHQRVLFYKEDGEEGAGILGMLHTFYLW